MPSESITNETATIFDELLPINTLMVAFHINGRKSIIIVDDITDAAKMVEALDRIAQHSRIANPPNPPEPAPDEHLMMDYDEMAQFDRGFNEMHNIEDSYEH